MRLDMTLDEFNSKGGEEWFIGELSVTLGVSKDMVEIIGVYEGSVIVVFEITDDKSNSIPLSKVFDAIEQSVSFGGISVLDTKDYVKPIGQLEE